MAIVGILFAITIATVGKVRSTAQQSRCVSNLRQLQLANILYANANRGVFVPVSVNDASGESSTKWHNFRAFVTMLSVGAKQTASIPDPLRCPVREPMSGNVGYGYNITGLPGGTGVPNYVRAASIRQIPRPSQTLAFADSVDWQISSGKADSYTGEVYAQLGTAYRHDNGAVVAYWDGHARRLPRAQVVGNTDLWRMME